MPKLNASKGKRTVGSLPMFRLEINDPTEAETLISQNLVCQVTSIYTRWKDFDLRFRASSAATAKVSVTRQKQVDQNKNVSSAERTILQKDGLPK